MVETSKAKSERPSLANVSVCLEDRSTVLVFKKFDYKFHYAGYVVLVVLSHEVS